MKKSRLQRSTRWRLRRAGALIVAPAVAITGLALLSSTPAVATGASGAAGASTPDIAALAGKLAGQEIAWEECDFGSPAANERLKVPNLKCASIKVPQDWNDSANGNTFDIRIAYVKNIDVKNPRYLGTLFGNPGGPGAGGLRMGPALYSWTPDLNPYYNYLGFDPRGTGQSSTVACEYTWTPSDKDPWAERKAMGQQCSANPQVKLINSEQTAYDMDFIRHLLGAPKLDYFGYSYGTWLGTWYGNIFGPNANKMVLDSSTDSTLPSLEKTWDLQPKARDRQFSMHLMNWLARNDATQGLGTDPRAIESEYLASAKIVTERYGPGTVASLWMFSGGAAAFSDNERYEVATKVIKFINDLAARNTASKAPSGDARGSLTDLDAALASLQQAPESSSYADELTAVRSEIATLTADAPSASVATDGKQTGTLTSPFTIIRCNDGQWTQGANYWTDRYRADAQKYPFSAGWSAFDGIPDCAYWRTTTMMPVADKATFPKTIVIQGEMDSQTAWEGGRVAGLKLPKTSFLAVDNEGSHGIFPYGTEAVDRPIINFFLTGKRPPEISVAQGKPLPLESTTYETWGQLDGSAQHVPVNPGPATPAGDTPTLKAKVKAKVAQVTKADVLPDESVDALRERLREEFGR